MTDPMELVGRLDMIVSDLQGLPHVTASVAEAAACIREMVEWRPIETAPRDGTRVLVEFDGAGPIVAYRDDDDERWVRYIGFGKSEHWPTVHADYALRWLPLPPAPGAEA